ncbi:MAG: 8-oxo-dGTP diphosphatase [Patescibacteria group bacterium]|jgi:ADP-ribose pyrophosphatase YjhB (NUDIX family)|nr:8-oxo-dGTP diphosphatase [Patescibacteria group bacterium]
MEEKLKEIGGPNKCPVAILIRDGKILFGQRNYTKEISVWTIPGGRCEEGETLEEALRREVYEEVGISDLKIVSFAGETSGFKEGDLLEIFFCTTEQDYKLMEPEKFSEWRWVSKEEYIVEGKYSGFNLDARKIILDNFPDKI